MIEFITILQSIAVGVATAVAISMLLNKILNYKTRRRKIEVAGHEVEIDLSDPEKVSQEIISLLDKPQVFIAYSSEDKKFAEEIAEDLQKRGLRIWIDIQQINPGDKLIQKIKEGLRKSGFFLAIVSESAIKSPMTQKEFKMAVVRTREGKWPRVIPVKIDDVEMPEYLRDTVYLDIRKGYQEGLDKIVQVVMQSSE